MHIINSIKSIFYGIFFIFFFGFLVEHQLFAEGFLHGTQVKTPMGYVVIEDLQVNDSVMCCDTEWFFTERSIIALHKKRVTHYIKIVVGNEFICVAIDQKFYIPKEQIWCEAQYLMPGDMLLSNGLTLMTIDDVVNVDEEVMVYDITVDGYHNFCVSSHDIHVHNVIPVIAAVGWPVGLGILEVAQATLAVVGTAIAFVVSRNNDKQKAKTSSSNFGGQSNNTGPSQEDDPDDKKQQRDEARNNHQPLTNKEARQKAKELGYKEDKNPPFDPRGRPAFRKGNDWITPDSNGHKGGSWKSFDRKGERTGTWNINLTEKIGK